MTASAAEYDPKLVTKRTKPQIGATGMKEKEKENQKGKKKKKILLARICKSFDRIMHESEGWMLAPGFLDRACEN